MPPFRGSLADIGPVPFFFERCRPRLEQPEPGRKASAASGKPRKEKPLPYRGSPQGAIRQAPL